MIPKGTEGKSAVYRRSQEEEQSRACSIYRRSQEEEQSRACSVSQMPGGRAEQSTPHLTKHQQIATWLGKFIILMPKQGFQTLNICPNKHSSILETKEYFLTYNEQCSLHWPSPITKRHQQKELVTHWRQLQLQQKMQYY